jgi:hypothetical protein
MDAAKMFVLGQYLLRFLVFAGEECDVALEGLYFRPKTLAFTAGGRQLFNRLADLCIEFFNLVHDDILALAFGLFKRAVSTVRRRFEGAGRTFVERVSS